MGRKHTTLVVGVRQGYVLETKEYIDKKMKNYW